MKSAGGRKKSNATTAKFTAAPDKQSAFNYAKKEFNIRLDQTSMSLNAMNAINEAMFKVKQEFGIGAFGRIHHIGKVANGTASNVQGYYNPMTQGLALRGVKYNNPQQFWSKHAQNAHKAGFWSTSNPMQTVYHELGHGIQYTLSQSQIKAIDNIRTSTLKKISSIQQSGGKAWKAQYLSRYGFTNTGEFIAESVAEYMNGGARPTAMAVIGIIKGN
ncbi:MAG: hypothetical protein ACI4IK_01555 [Eubacterium sp.]